MNTFRIAKNVPLPTGKQASTAGRKRKYPFDQMSVGHSFAFPPKLAPAVRSAAHAFRTQHNPESRFSVRGMNGSYRCWRIA